MRKIAIYTAIACTAFLAAFVTRTRQAASGSQAQLRPPSDAPDSLRLAALGIRPGLQLVAFVFGGSRCGFCQKPETKRALAGLRDSLVARHVVAGSFKAVSVVGVAVNSDIHEGMAYLESIGPDAFNEISVGSGWQNEHIVRLLRREQMAEPAVPLVIVVSRSMAATLAPLRLTYGADSVVKVVQGSRQIVDWISNGVRFTPDKSHFANGERLDTATNLDLGPAVGSTQGRR